MDLLDCRFDGNGHFKIGDHPTSAHVDKDERIRYEERTEQKHPHDRSRTCSVPMVAKAWW